MQLAKGVTRGTICLARYAGALLLYALTLFIVAGLLALYIGARSGQPVGRFFVALAVSVFSFAAILSLMLVTSIGQPLTGMAVLAGYLLIVAVGVLNNRAMLYRVIKQQWLQFTLDWAYRLLPKMNEMNLAASQYWQGKEIETWWPFWTSGVFLAAMLALAVWSFHRRSY
jgi:ABC-type transport system involved in multi-copper enzyme maturation permease subunit